MSTMNSVDRLSKNLNKVLDNVDAQKMAADLQAITQNVNDISNYVCTMTKDDKLKKQLTETVNKVNTAMTDISNALSVVNSMSPAQKAQVQQIVEDSAKTTHNLRLFTDKLNKRFLLFRLMF
jgi:methyl-accepting chemotaxis protein